MFSYEHLAAFCATVEAGSYSGAARLLNKDRTTIREQVKMLEDSYAIHLFVIQGKKAVVTEAGQAIYKQARLLVKNSEILHNRISNSYKATITSIDIYHDVLVPSSLIIAVERASKKRMPHVKLNWLHRLREESLPNFNTGKHQLGIMQARLKNEADFPIGFQNLGTLPLHPYCSSSHEFASKSDLSIEDLQIEKQYISENNYVSMPEIFSISTDLSIVSNNDVLVELIKHSGWGVINAEYAQRFVDNGELVPIAMQEVVTHTRAALALYYPLEISDSPEFSIISQAIQEYAKSYLK